jgi:hypothetical protein
VSENKFAPLMAEFLRHIAQEVENNKALARRLAEPFQAVLNDALAEKKVSSKSAAKTKQKQYPIPEGLDPYKIYYDEGSPGLYNKLQTLTVDELKGVLAKYTAIPRAQYTRKQKCEDLVQMAVQEIKAVASRGQAFGDYKLDM